jgi:hypothetical protein
MPTITIPTKSIFATDHTLPDDVKLLIKEGVAHMSAEGDIRWKDVPAAARPSDVTGGLLDIKYSRAWLIVRRAYLEVHAPNLLVTLPAEGADKETTNREWSKVIQPMREVQNLSWGEISVRVGKPESKIRSCFRATNAKKDIGLRIGKGGRMAYDDKELYLEHRKAEGAQIPVEVKGRPAVTNLLNAANPTTGEVVAFKRAVATAAERVQERAKRTGAAPAAPKQARKPKATKQVAKSA